MLDVVTHQTALRVALRHSEAPTTTADERQAILSAIVEAFSGPTGELAAQTLFHLREQRRHQLLLADILRDAE